MLNNNLKLFLGIAAGAAVGYGIGLLTAPHRGIETRKKIFTKLDELKDELKNTAVHQLEKAKSSYNENLADAASKTKHSIDVLKDKVSIN